MNTFKDLVFRDNLPKVSFSNGSLTAKINFNNNYGILVIPADGDYEDLYHVVTLFNDDINYQTPIADDVLWNKTEPEINNLMERIQKL